MSEGEFQAMQSYGGDVPATTHPFDKVECPICGKPRGGRSVFSGERGRLHGVHMHMKVSHGIKQKWKRDAMIAESEGRTNGA